jgi:phosphate transport system permease protein
VSAGTTAPPRPPARAAGQRREQPRRKTSLFARGEPMVWLTGGALVLCLLMVVGLLVLVFGRGMATFWPSSIVEIQTVDGQTIMGEVTREETYRPEESALDALPDSVRVRADALLAASGGESVRRLVRTGNYELTGVHFVYVDEYQIESERLPEGALILERETWGRFYGLPKEFRVDGKAVSTDPARVVELLDEHHPEVRELWDEKQDLEKHDLGELSRRREEARLEAKRVAIDHGVDSRDHLAALEEVARVDAACDEAAISITAKIRALNDEMARFVLVMDTSDGQVKEQPLAEIVRAYPANDVGFFSRVGIYLSRWWEFLTAEPREANSEGGVFPAIFGTVVMTLLMSVFVVPFGVLAALYLREYAKQGFVVSAVRVAINNLAGVPSIVYGVFGLGFFCYIVGANIDQVFFPERLPSPTYGKGGVLWASLTLALLTLPVVIVATEEALAAVPGSMREGSYACGASKWQTMRRIVLPRAGPGIMTGMVLAMARGAGEVAPLMLVGAVKLAPELPMDGQFPFLHPDRSFMHLGFHIYDVGFQSQNSQAAQPLVFTTTLLLIAIVLVLNVTAIWVRSRLRRKFSSDKF